MTLCVNVVIVAVLVFVCANAAAAARDAPAASRRDVPRGHMQPLGGHADPTPVDIVERFPSAKVFLEEYVNKCQPLVVRNAQKSLAMERWDDEYLKKHYRDIPVKMEPKREKQNANLPEKANAAHQSVGFFLDELKDWNYVVSQLPDQMAHEFEIPAELNCSPFSKNWLEANVWISSGETKSTLHKDALNTINCQIRGYKNWTLIDHKYAKLIPLAIEGGTDPYVETAGFSLLDVTKVDLLKYPDVAKAPYMHAQMHPGDCLYIPGSLLHQVNSSPGTNIAYTVMFSGPTSATDQTKKVRVFDEVDEAECQAAKNTTIAEADFAWTYDGTGEKAFTMGFEDPLLFRLNWMNYADEFRGKINRKQFRQLMIGDIKERVQRGLDDRHKETAFDMKKEMRKALEEAQVKFFDVLAKDRGFITKEDIKQAPRRVFRDGMRHLFYIDYIHSLYDDGANVEYQGVVDDSEGDDRGRQGQRRGRGRDRDEDAFQQRNGGGRGRGRDRDRDEGAEYDRPRRGGQSRTRSRDDDDQDDRRGRGKNRGQQRDDRDYDRRYEVDTSAYPDVEEEDEDGNQEQQGRARDEL